MLKFNFCEKCEVEFKVYAQRMHSQKLCPTCRQERDIEKSRQRNSVTLEREKLFSAPVTIHSLPGEWMDCEPIKSNATRYWKMEVRGSQYGRNWDGQITIFSHMKSPPQVGDTVYMRIMRAEKRVKQITFFKESFNAGRVESTATLPAYTTEEEIPALIESGKLHPNAAGSLLMDATIEHEYIVLDGTHREPEYNLVWAEARTKTTIKGFGAQYRSDIDLSNAYWHQSIYGGVRSGRAHTTGTLALVPIGDSVAVKMSGVSGSGKPDGRYNWEQGFPECDDVNASDEDLLGLSALAKLRGAAQLGVQPTGKTGG